MSTEIAKKPELVNENGALALRDIDQMYRFGTMIISSGMAPKDINKPEQVVVIVGHGLELGMKPFQSLQNIACINGRPSLWGDSMKGLVMCQRDLDEFLEEEVGEYGKDTYGYRTTIVRGKNKCVSTFTVADAKQAKLWGKAGPWTFYPKRMLQMRSRSFACRDAYPDVLKGMRTAEENMDIPATVMGADGGSAPYAKDGLKEKLETAARAIAAPEAREEMPVETVPVEAEKPAKKTRKPKKETAQIDPPVEPPEPEPVDLEREALLKNIEALKRHKGISFKKITESVLEDGASIEHASTVTLEEILEQLTAA